MKYLKKLESWDLDTKLINISSNKSSLQKMRELINVGADVNFIDISDGTPLIRATVALFYSGIKLLIVSGANINTIDHLGESAFLKLSRFPKSTQMKNHILFKKIIDLFVSNGADMNIKSNKQLDIFDNFYEDIRKYIEYNYPKEYNNYLIKKESEIYNL